MTLNMVGVGGVHRIIGCRADDKVRRQLETLGLVPGETVHVISENNGSIIIEVKSSRLALGKTMADSLIVA